MKAETKLRFDDALPAMIEVVKAHLGQKAIDKGVVLRDASGRLSFYNGANVSVQRRLIVSDALRKALGGYAYADRVFATPSDPGVSTVLSDPSAIPWLIDDSRRCRLIDRRIIGSEWLAEPIQEEAQPPRLVFSSVKGGVGRSTAVAITAADMARRGLNVLVVDLDLEAPGIGHTLLDAKRLPRYGSVDYLVENGTSGISDADLNDFVGVSQLTQGVGLVEVLPATGIQSQRFPENYMAKLSRAMLEDIHDDLSVSLSQQIREMIQRLGMRRAYDAILIDARAGMTELAAGPIIGLGATVLLFGTPQAHTIEGYRSLFASLSLLANREPDAMWRRRLKMVYAKALAPEEESSRRFIDDLWVLFSTYLYDSSETATDLEAFNYDPDDMNAPHVPLVIPFNPSFNLWEPVNTPSQLTISFYDATFRPFLDGLRDLLGPQAIADETGSDS